MQKKRNFKRTISNGLGDSVAKVLFYCVQKNCEMNMNKLQSIMMNIFNFILNVNCESIKIDNKDQGFEKE